MKKKTSALLLLAILFFAIGFTSFRNPNSFISSNSNVKFTTKGPLGIIIAQSKKMTGSLDASKKTFAFSIPVSSFQGFANPLQKQHFNEKYMESPKIPNATFKGKIIEEIDLGTPGVYPIRAKGTMTIHGVDKEIIVKSKLTIKSGQLMIESFFNVLLGDYDIKIPTIVYQQVKDDIAVEVKIDMIPEK